MLIQVFLPFFVNTVLKEKTGRLPWVNEITVDIYLAGPRCQICHHKHVCLIKKFPQIIQQGHVAVKPLKSMSPP